MTIFTFQVRFPLILWTSRFQITGMVTSCPILQPCTPERISKLRSTRRSSQLLTAKVVFAGYGLLNGAGDKDDPYGLAVVIRHNLSFQNRTILTVYAHMEKTTVQKGDWVKAGDQIGNVGLTGATSGPHLHIEIRLEINANEYEVQNPEMWIVPSIGNGVLAGRVMTTGGGLLGERQIWVKSLETGETWTMYTYSTRMKHLDPYYHENLLLSDLAAGKYEVSFYYFGLQKQIVEIHPGAITFFQYMGKNGFTIGDPAPPSTDEFLTHF